MFSKEDGSPAEKMPNQIHGNTKKSRYNKIMRLQKGISKEIRYTDSRSLEEKRRRHQKKKKPPQIQRR